MNYNITANEAILAAYWVLLLLHYKYIFSFSLTYFYLSKVLDAGFLLFFKLFYCFPQS